MLRLTLRSRTDGRFLARVIDRNSGPFVLDFGDPQTVQEVSDAVIRAGFRVNRGGATVTASPRDPELIVLLAHHYASKGVLVFLDQPDFAGRADTVEERLPATAHLDPDESTDHTEDTDIVSAREVLLAPAVARLGPVPLTPIVALPDLDEDDVPTEQVDRDPP